MGSDPCGAEVAAFVSDARAIMRGSLAFDPESAAVTTG
jgi:hypothetical protein